MKDYKLSTLLSDGMLSRVGEAGHRRVGVYEGWMMFKVSYDSLYVRGTYLPCPSSHKPEGRLINYNTVKRRGDGMMAK